MDPIDNIKPRSHFNVLRWLLIISIMIVLNLFFNYAISSFYHAPKYEDFCKSEQINVQPTSKEVCVNSGGQWNESSTIEKPIPMNVRETQKLQTTSFCDTSFTCRKNYEQSLEFYQRNVFVALVILGVITLTVGFAISASSVVSLGLSFGGVLSLLIASIRYWSAMNEYIRVIILGLALAVLIWLGIKKFKE